jgi:hypothetical protein
VKNLESRQNQLHQQKQKNLEAVSVLALSWLSVCWLQVLPSSTSENKLFFFFFLGLKRFIIQESK